VPARAFFTDRRSVIATNDGAGHLPGASAFPYDGANLGAHVGDDPLAVQANRLALAGLLAVPTAQLTWMDQVHGAAVRTVAASGDGLDGAGGPGDVQWFGEQPVYPAADGLVTAATNTALAVLVADCVPVLLADERAGVIAAVHAGRQGMAKRVVPVALDAMADLGAHAADIQAWLGPSICGLCYEVPAALQQEVAQVAPESVATTRQGTPALDIPAGVAAQLRAAGVASVWRSPRCTAEDPDLYSYRRDGVTGRTAGVVVLQQ
jgi:YfiH family protein